MENQISSEKSATKNVPIGNHEDAVYDAYLGRIADRFTEMTQAGELPLFTTDADQLWDAYLAGFDLEQRQFHTCSACRHFIEQFGGLVVISEGVTGSAFWNEADAPPLYKAAIGAMARIVRRAKVTGVFLSSLPVWGQPVTGVWRHFSFVPFKSQVFKHALDTPHQASAAKREDYNNVCRALGEFKPQTIEQAVTLLKMDALYRSEKVLGQAQWLADLSIARLSARGDRRDNVTWERIAKAPDGFCHPRSSMIGTLLEDLDSGIPIADVARKFADKMNPTAYQRPQAAPTARNIARAEEIVKKLGIAPSLPRRFARRDEVQALWVPAETSKDSSVAGGVFGHLTPKESTPERLLDVPAQAITWVKLQRTVLADAKSIELLVPSQGNFCALVTAENADAPPIFQWDAIEQRNPVSLYVYDSGSPANRWGLNARQWTKVTALTARPAHWFGGDFAHHAQAAVFILDGAKDANYKNIGVPLFPETLRAELREVRATIEAHSKVGTLGGYENASACGLMFQSQGSEPVHLRVTLANGTRVEYKLDRWD